MRKVAIIEDDPSQRFVVKGFLERLGCEVVAEGGDGLEAVSICKAHSPEVVFMDVKMPRKDGIDAALEINRLCPTPTVIMTACDDKETIERAAGAGVMAYLVKPVREEELFPAMELAIARFGEFRKLSDENLGLKNALEARKVIERAKGLLMEKDGLSEVDAFSKLRKASMNLRKPMKEVAELLVVIIGEGGRGGMRDG